MRAYTISYSMEEANRRIQSYQVAASLLKEHGDYNTAFQMQKLAEELNNAKMKSLQSTKAEKTVMKVTFKDGRTFYSDKACDTFIDVIKAVAGTVGMERLVNLGLQENKFPLFSRSPIKDNNYETEKCKRPLGNGWFVKTHSSTSNKVKALEYIKSKFGIIHHIQIL